MVVEKNVRITERFFDNHYYEKFYRSTANWKAHQELLKKAVITDPNATVAWSGSLTPELKTDISFKTFMGRGSGESIQMKFQGQGFVVIQPCEESYFQAA